MTKTEKLIQIRLHADDISRAALLAYWTNEEYHMKSLNDALTALDELLDQRPMEENNETN